MKVEYFPTKNWYSSKRNMELFEDRVQPCHWKVFSVKRLDSFVLGGNAEGILRQRDKLKITDQSEALFKQKRWFKKKKNDRVASRLEMDMSGEFHWQLDYTPCCETIYRDTALFLCFFCHLHKGKREATERWFVLTCEYHLALAQVALTGIRMT